MTKHELRKIQRILQTQKGERVMNPDYGVNWTALQDSNAPNIDIKYALIETLENEIPGLEIEKIEISGGEVKEVVLHLKDTTHAFPVD